MVRRSGGSLSRTQGGEAGAGGQTRRRRPRTGATTGDAGVLGGTGILELHRDRSCRGFLDSVNDLHNIHGPAPVVAVDRDDRGYLVARAAELKCHR